MFDGPTKSLPQELTKLSPECTWSLSLLNCTSDGLLPEPQSHGNGSQPLHNTPTVTLPPDDDDGVEEPTSDERGVANTSLMGIDRLDKGCGFDPTCLVFETGKADDVTSSLVGA